MEHIPVEPGSVMALSGQGLGDYSPGDNLFPTTSGRSMATPGDVERMINDILTVEQ
jgi:hypothetical protein